MKDKLLFILNRVQALVLFCLTLFLNSQTNPTPHNLSASNFNFSGLAVASTTYPTSMQGWQTSANNITTAETAPPTGNYALSLVAPGIYNGVLNGYSLQSTNSGASLRVGSIALALNTTGRDNISVSWTAQDLSAGTRRQTNLALQYRIGNTGNFTTLAGTTYSTNTTSQRSAQNYNITLPYECTDEPLVQLRWIYYETGTASTTRDPIRLDDISVTSNGMSCSQKPSSLVVNTVANTTAQISWTAASPLPASGYDYYYTTSNTPPIDTTTPTGNTTATSLSITGLTANTTYNFWVRSKCGGGNQQSKWVLIQFKTFCTPNFNNTDKGRLYINSFQFVGVLNATVANISTWASGYQNFTSFTPIAEQPQGTALNIFASSGSTRVPNRTNGTWKAWVDWNKDGDFNDTGEEVYNMISFTTPSVTFGFVIPSNQPLGNYTLRIGTFSQNGTDFNSCATDTGYGEMEDYTFKVVTDCPAKVLSVNSVNPYDGERCGEGSVRLSAIGNASAVSYNWYDAVYGGNFLGSGNEFYTPSISTTTTYYVTAVSSTGCETAFRYPVEARIDPNPTVSFSSSDPAICGEDKPSLLVTASGDKYQDVIFEKFDSGLGVFSNVVDGAYTGTLGYWQNRMSPYIPTLAEGYEGLSPAMSSGYFGEGFAMINTDIDRGTSAQSILNRMVSSDLNVSGYLNLKLDFDLYNFTIAFDFTEGYTLIEYSLDGGTNWVTLDQFIGYKGNPLKWQKFSYNIPGSNFTSTNFKLRFSVYSYAGPFPSSGNGFIEGITAVDNVRIYGFKTINTPFAWNSATTTIYDTDCNTVLSGTDLRSTVCVKPNPVELEDLNWTLNANATFSNGCDAIGAFTVDNDTKTWKQPGITDWNLGAQWKPTNVPNINKCVITRTPVELPSGTTGTHGLARSVINKPGGTITISPKSSLTIQNYIKNEAAAADVLVDDDANLIQNNNSAINTGNITVRRSANLKRLDYNYWGSPVNGQNVRNFSPNTLTNRFYVYREKDNFFDGVFSYSSYAGFTVADAFPLQNQGTYPFEVGKGYAIRAANNLSGVSTSIPHHFVGVPNNGVIDVPVVKSASGEGYNLISNPYPSNIDFYALYNYGTNSSVIYNTAYFWTNTNFNPKMQGSVYPSNLPDGTQVINNYAVLNGTGGVGAPYGFTAGTGTNTPVSMVPTSILKPGQGFAVKAKINGNVRYENGANIRTNNANAVFFNRMASRDSNTQKDRFWLNLKTPLDFVSPILIGYIKGATDDYEIDYDAELLVEGGDSFYTLLNGRKLAIQGKKYPLHRKDIIPLGARFGLEGSYEIFIDKKEGDFTKKHEVFLKDKLTNTITNLSKESYQFTATAGEVEDRFEILFDHPGKSDDKGNGKNNTKVYQSKNKIFVESLKNIRNVKIYNFFGKKIYEKDFNELKIEINSQTYTYGIYFVVIKTDEDTEIRAVLIN